MQYGWVRQAENCLEWRKLFLGFAATKDMFFHDGMDSQMRRLQVRLIGA